MNDTVSAVGRKNTIYYINSFIAVAFMFGFGFLSPIFDGITAIGMKGLGVLLGLFWGWTFVDITWPSIMSFLALAYWQVDTTSLNAINASGFGSNTPLVILFVGVFGFYLTKCGLIKWLSEWFVSRKIAVGRPYVFVYLIAICAHVLAGIISSSFPVVILCFALCYELAKHLGYEKKSPQVVFLLGAVVVGTSYGSYAFPWDIASLYYNNAIRLTMPEVSIPFLTQVTVYNLWALFGMGMYCLFGKFILRIDYSDFIALGDAFGGYRGQKMNKDQRHGMMLMSIFMVLVTYANVAPADWPLARIFASWNVVGFGMLFLMIACIVRDKVTGDPVYNIEQLFERGTPWASFFMIAATVPVCAILEGDESGVMAVVANFILPKVEGLSPFFALLVVLLFFCIVTQFMHNLVVGGVFIPMLGPVMYELGVHPYVWVFGMGLILATAYITPACSGCVALLYANNEWAEQKMVYKHMAIAFLASLAAFLVTMPILFRIFTV